MTITNRVSLKSVMGGNTPIADVVDAPTIGTATAGVESATVAYTAAATGGAATSFTAISTPGSITGTGASPITVSGLTGGTAYTFKVYGTNASGAWSGVQSQASNSVTPAVATSFESIATATPSGVSTITFSSIPQTYKSLQIRGICTDAGVNTLLMRMNGVTTTSYSSHTLEGDGITPVASGDGTQTNMQIAGRYYGLSNSASIFAGVILDIHDYASTSKYKTVRSFSGFDANGVAGAPGDIGIGSGLFQSTSAVTSITLYIASNFSSGTTFALYGIN